MVHVKCVHVHVNLLWATTHDAGKDCSDIAENRHNAGNGKGLLAATSAFTDTEDPQLLAAMEIRLSKNKLKAKHLM